jgi:F0F1-type ATP synthase assembly protein I
MGDFFWLGTACALSIIGAGAIGWGLDSWLGTQPWLVLGGLAFGVLCAVLLSWAQIRKFL